MTDYKAKTMQAYNTNADAFADKFRRLMDFPDRYEFDQFLELLHGNTVLDLGCGAGDHSVYFKQQGIDITSIDFSQAMITKCKEKGLNAKVMDAEDLQFPPQSFNGVWAVSSLLHIPKSKLTSVASRIHDLLQENGLLYVCMKEGKGERFVSTPHHKDQERYFSFWHEDELTGVFDQFTPVQLDQVSFMGQTYLKQFYRRA